METMALKALITTWHTPHQFDMINALKGKVDFDIFINNCKKWKGREIPDFATPVYYADPDKYDFVILNMDQQLINPNFGKSKLFRDLISVYKEMDTPVIVLMHGTPVWPEHLQYGDMTAEDAQNECIKQVKELIGDWPMVVNSHESATSREWGWGNPIVHGMNPNMWESKPKELKVITALSSAGCDKYYNRELMEEVGNRLKRKHGYEIQWARVNVPSARNPQEMDIDAYKEWMSDALIYVDTSIRTPMNRGRTEAMLSGCCVVQVEGAHDIDRFFKDGENIVLVKDEPEAISNKIFSLLTLEHDKAIEIGQNARKNAIEQFSYPRYAQDWINLLKKLNIWK